MSATGFDIPYLTVMKQPLLNTIANIKNNIVKITL